jgi:hypothetical protein
MDFRLTQGLNRHLSQSITQLRQSNQLFNKFIFKLKKKILPLSSLKGGILGI